MAVITCCWISLPFLVMSASAELCVVLKDCEGYALPQSVALLSLRYMGDISPSFAQGWIDVTDLGLLLSIKPREEVR